MWNQSSTTAGPCDCEAWFQKLVPGTTVDPSDPCYEPCLSSTHDKFTDHHHSHASNYAGYRAQAGMYILALVFVFVFVIKVTCIVHMRRRRLQSWAGPVAAPFTISTSYSVQVPPRSANPVSTTVQSPRFTADNESYLGEWPAGYSTAQFVNLFASIHAYNTTAVAEDAPPSYGAPPSYDSILAQKS